jgi:hypothetical protein
MSIYLFPVLIVLLLVVAAACVFFKEWPDSAVDEARNTLFELRDQLFELGKIGAVPFDSRAYQLHRDLINGMIRFAHDINVTQMFFTGFLLQRQNKELARELKEKIDGSLKNLGEQAREEVVRISDRATETMFKLVLTRSVLATTIMVCFVAVVMCKHILGAAQQLAVRKAPVKDKPSQGAVDDVLEEVLSERRMRGVRAQINVESAKYASKPVGSYQLLAVA